MAKQNRNIPLSHGSLKGSVMGQFIVNGQVVDLRSPQPTARELKAHTVGASQDDGVMAYFENGEYSLLRDDEVLPSTAIDYNISPQHSLGDG